MITPRDPIPDSEDDADFLRCLLFALPVSGLLWWGLFLAWGWL